MVLRSNSYADVWRYGLITTMAAMAAWCFLHSVAAKSKKIHITRDSDNIH